MKVAVVYNRDSKSVINLFGIPNQEKIGLKTIRRILDALKSGGHQAVAIEGDKELVDKLEQFMPRVLRGENPGMVFNLSYGIQGQARYTHVPSILEMVGIPYVGSGPLAHSLALDKVVSKIIFSQHGIPTPEFAVLKERGFDPPELDYPLIVKPKNEAVSFGIRIVRNLKELREAADNIFNKFSQPVLVERYVAGREINVGLIGNSPVEVLPAAEINFGRTGPKIYRYEDKTGTSNRSIRVHCPARLSKAQLEKAQKIARDAFSALGCFDCARVDMRLDHEGRLYVLEVNSLPSLGEHGSYTHAAKAAGLDYAALVNRLVDVASARYFGTPHPPEIPRKIQDPGRFVFSYITQRRDRIEKRLREWIRLSSRTSDPVGLREARKKFEVVLEQLGLAPQEELSNEHSAWTWQTKKGLDAGTLLVLHLDVPIPRESPVEAFRLEPEWLYGEGVGISRAPLVMLEFALQSIRAQRQLRNRRLGVLFYIDEGRDALYSKEVIRRAAARAKQVIVLRPGIAGDCFIHQRRGQRKYALHIEGRPRRMGQAIKQPEALLWFGEKLGAISKLASRKDRLSVAAVDVKVVGFPLLVPHRIDATLLMSYLDAKKADGLEKRIREALGKNVVRWDLKIVSDRPPMKDRLANKQLAKAILQTAAEWEIDIQSESSAWPSVGGLVTGKTAVICGLGPMARNLYTPHECVKRISLIQRTLLLAQLLLRADGA
ncbi:MAG: ATP-grasp domain-containing protein [Candidatus Latescibacteria bacterium]|nr:ATP-grasp domain-containing protein [Candidatus Latescibacterota bacterium]NIO57350.1 ATP-grasp domain-containing protein [Candidatus Latescibacterota bacterium]